MGEEGKKENRLTHDVYLQGLETFCIAMALVERNFGGKIVFQSRKVEPTALPPDKKGY